LASAIEQRLADFLADEDPRRADQRGLAAQLHAIPLYADLGACIAIRPNGELISVHSNQDWSKPKEWTPEIEPKWRTVALATGSRKYLEVKVLLPVKGPDDLEVTDRGGTSGARA
jgi:hypothetical protein